MGKRKSGRTNQTFGIGAVARLTGLTDHTIRAWERRYQAVSSGRAANGRRLYTAADVEKLGLLKALTDRGLSIGRIAGEPVDALRRRVESLGDLALQPVPETINTAVLGDFLPGRFAEAGLDPAPVNVVVAATDEDRFRLDIGGQGVDVLVLELPVLGEATHALIRELMELAGARHAVLVYSFGRSADVEHLTRAGVVAVRAPASVDEVRAAVLRAYSLDHDVRAPARRGSPAVPSPRGVIEPRRFTQSQLATLASRSTTIKCECPHHLAELVRDLSAFELYSAQCENRNDDDAALHAYLHHRTAAARAMIEEALQRVVEAEGIEH